MGGWAKVRCTGRYDNISFNMKTTFLFELEHILNVKNSEIVKSEDVLFDSNTKFSTRWNLKVSKIGSA